MSGADAGARGRTVKWQAWRRVAAGAGVVLGVLLGVAGAFLSGMYLWSLVGVLGAADRSVVFWYGIILIAGMTLTGAGVGLLLLISEATGPDGAGVRREFVRAWMWIVGLAGGLAAAGGVVLALWHVLVLRMG